MKFVYDMGTIMPSDPEAAAFLSDAEDGTVLEFKVITGKRTAKQNAAIHKYCDMLAESLGRAGFDMLTYPWKQGLQIPFTGHSVKTIFWKPVQEAMLGKESTRALEPKEVNVIYEALDRANSERTGVHVEFPCKESLREA